jgi:ATP-binding cassette subfamily F protein 3
MLIEKFRAKKSKASFAQSLIKKLDKMDLIEVEQDETASMYFKFPPCSSLWKSNTQSILCF